MLLGCYRLLTFNGSDSVFSKYTQEVLFCLSLLQNRAARIRVGKGDKPVTYEQAHHPHHIGHRKGWLSQHTSKHD